MGSFNELSPFLNDLCSGDRRWNRLERGLEGDRKGTERGQEGGREEKGRDEKREENLNH